MNAHETTQASARSQTIACASIFASILVIAAFDLLFLQQAAALVS